MKTKNVKTFIKLFDFEEGVMAENTRPAWQDRQQQKETKGQTGNSIKTKSVKTFIVLFDFEAGDGGKGKVCMAKAISTAARCTSCQLVIQSHE